LLLRKIIKIVATRCQISRVKCTKFDFGWGSAPDPAQHLAGFNGPTSKGRGRRGRKRGQEGEGRDQVKGKGREEERGRREGKGTGMEGKV